MNGMETADVVVVGVGSMGAMALWRLSAKTDGTGARIIGLDRYGPGHVHGSFSGESRLFRVAVKEGGIYVPLALEAAALYRELEREVGRELLLQVGALSIGPRNFPLMESTREAIAEFGLDHEYLSADELRSRFPQFRVDDGDEGILDPLGGGIRPEASVVAAAMAAQRKGAEIRWNTPVLSVEPTGDGVVVRTSAGPILAHRVIIGAGSWTPRLRPDLAALITVQPIVLTWFMPRDISAHGPESLPVFMRDLVLGDGQVVHVFGAPSLDGYSVKVSPSRMWPATDDPSRLPTPTHEEMMLIGQQVQMLMPDMHPEPVRCTMHHDGFTPDGTPIIDVDRELGIVTVAGMSGKGMKFAPVFGDIAAELALGRESGRVREEFSVGAHLGS